MTNVTKSFVAIRPEQHVGEARTRVRVLCEDAGADDFVTQRAVTIVSELARNILKHVSAGWVELEVDNRTLRVVAIDEGRGIPSVEGAPTSSGERHISLGKGLTGVRRLADSFDLRTGPTGTRVEATIRLRG